MFCIGCGAQIPDNSRNCPYCGTGVFGEAPNYNDSNMNNYSNMGNNSNMGATTYLGNNLGNNPNMGGSPNMGGDMNGGRKFCISCGSENDSDSQFCVVCGKPMAQSGQQSWDTWNPAIAAERQQKRYRKIGIIGAGVIVVAVIILIFGVFLKKSYEDTIEQIMNAAMYGDISGLYELIHPDIFTNQIDELLDEYDAEMEYEIRYAEELTGYSLAGIQDTYDAYGLDVDEAMLVGVRVTFYSVRYDLEESESYDIYLIKIDGDWYLDTENTTDLFGSNFSFSLF